MSKHLCYRWDRASFFLSSEMPACFYLPTPKVEGNPCCPSPSVKQSRPSPATEGSLAPSSAPCWGQPAPAVHRGWGRPNAKWNAGESRRNAGECLHATDLSCRHLRASLGGTQISRNKHKGRKEGKKDPGSGRICQTLLTWQRPAVYICFSQKQNKWEMCLGGKEVGRHSMNKHIDKKEKWCNRNSPRHRNPCLQLRLHSWG